MKILRNEIHKMDQKYDLLLEDFKKLGLENEKLKKWAKGKTSHPRKKAKVEENKKTKELQKEVDTLKKQVHQIKKEVFEASNQWEKKYTKDVGRNKKEGVEMKIRM